MDIAYESSFPTPYAYSPILPLLLMTLARQKNAPTTATSIYPEYDYIVVGAGSAGSVVASRLSEIPCTSVLLLEAGKAPPIINDIPALGRSFWFTDLDWAYKTVPQKYTGNGLVNRQLVWPSGKALGGSSIINAMIYVRGNRKDYDLWESMGAKGWSYKDVLPYFLKLENNHDPEYLANGYHGSSGPVTVERPRYDSELRDSVFDAAEKLGYRIVDSNGHTQLGFYDYQENIRDGQRCSTAKAYLVPAENRTNLAIVPNAFVQKVSITNGQATGVIVDLQGTTYELKARKEVIMSAGTVNSAQLLMLSGIGPKKHLEDMQIPVVADLPVGENFHDQCTPVGNYELDHSIPTFAEKLLDQNNVNQYIYNRTGPLTSAEGASAVAFLKRMTVTPDVTTPNFQLYFAEGDAAIAKQQFGLIPEYYEQIYAPYEKQPFFFCFSSLMQAKSRGTVRLNSANPYDPPLIDPNYFADPSDLEDVAAGLKACHRIASSAPMQSIGVKPFKNLYPGCEQYAQDEDQYFKCQAQQVVVTLSHQVGTAKMGDPNDPTTVVDPQLRVKGIKGLRVVDASVMPIVPSGNTNIPTIMLAEKASDIIKTSIHCLPHSPPKYYPNPYYGDVGLEYC